MASNKAVSNKNMNSLKIVNLGAPTQDTDAARLVDVTTAGTDARSRANHTGTQLANTISDLDAAVRANRLDQMAAPTSPVAIGSQRLTSVGDPSGAQDAATKAYVDNQLAGLVTGQTLKGSVRAVVATNVTIATPGATLDGISASNGDVFLLAGQSTGAQNGPYVFNGAASPMTRATNWDNTSEAVLGSYWVVREGTRADSFAIMTNDSAITLDTTTPVFTYISVAGASIGRFSVDCPVTTAGGTWTVTHNLNSMDVHVMVRRVASPYDYVDVYFEAATVNTVAIKPDLALAAGEYRAIVKY